VIALNTDLPAKQALLIIEANDPDLDIENKTTIGFGSPLEYIKSLGTAQEQLLAYSLSK
jgi:hypothetical protein